MLIAVGQINTTVGDMPGNAAKMAGFARRADERGAQLVVFPELAVCGYPPRDLVQCNGFADDNQHWLMELAHQLPADLTAKVGYVTRSPQACGKPFANARAVLKNGMLLYSRQGFYCQRMTFSMSNVILSPVGIPLSSL